MDERSQDPIEFIHEMFMVHECQGEACEVCYRYQILNAELAGAI